MNVPEDFFYDDRYLTNILQEIRDKETQANLNDGYKSNVQFVGDTQKMWAEECSRFRMARRIVKLSIDQLAAMTNHSPSTLDSFERGRPVRNREALGEAYQLVVGELLIGAN